MHIVLGLNIVCTFVLFVVDAIGDHLEEEYSSFGLVTALYVVNNVSLCLPHLVEERILSVVIVLDALVAMSSMCLLEVNIRSRISSFLPKFPSLSVRIGV